VADPQDIAWLDDAVAPAVHRDVDGSRYGFYRLEQAAMQLAESWAVGAVARLQQARLLGPYEGVDLAPILTSWLYYRFRPDAMACVRLARVLEVERESPTRVVVASPLRAALFTRVLQEHGVRRTIISRASSRPQRVKQSATPLARVARDVLRRLPVRRSRHEVSDASRLLFISHHPTVRPRVRPVLAEMVRRGWSVGVVNVEGAPPSDETLPIFEVAYAHQVPRGRAVTRIYRHLGPMRRRLGVRSAVDDLPGVVPFPARSWTRVVREALYTVLSEIEILGRILRENGSDVLMYSNRSALGALAHGVAAAQGVPSVLVQLTESFWDDDFRHCRADLYTAMGQTARERLMKVGADPERIVVTGSDHYFEDPEMDAVAAKAAVCADLGLDAMGPRDRLVLLVSQNREFLNPDPYRWFVYASILAAVRALPDVRLVVKLHPRETDSLTRECFGVLPSGLCAVTPDYRLGTLLEASDAVIIKWSTVGLQAVERGRPVVVINYKGDGAVVPCAVEGAALSVEDPGALSDALRAALYDEDVRAELRRRGTVFLERYLSPNDGRAAERIADATEALRERGEGRHG
jgi:hypothetical protein